MEIIVRKCEQFELFTAFQTLIFYLRFISKHEGPYSAIKKTDSHTILKISNLPQLKKHDNSKWSSIQFQIVVHLLSVTMIFVQGHMVFQTLIFVCNIDQ